MSATFQPADDTARQKTRQDLATSLVLEAGAGTGKTTLLVDRIEALVRTGTATLDQVAAVTFTENAATTLKLRLRERLERLESDTSASTDERERARAALAILERAPISTIHALCAAILQERPLDVGVSPGFRVADDGETDKLFAEAWEEWLGEAFESGDATVLEALDSGIPLEGKGPYDERWSLRGFARTLLEQRDLRPLVSAEPPNVEAWRNELMAQGGRARALAAKVQPGDALGTRLVGLAEYAGAAGALSGRALVEHLLRIATIPKNFGFKPRWPTSEALEEGRRIAEWTKTAVERWRAALGAALHGRIVSALQGVVRRYEDRKRAAGVLDFLDLLLEARDALRDRESVRLYFRERFRYLIIDEFQDTDPLQVEIAELLSRGVVGGLVVVGDAKQSIYRFRRAEVALFERTARQAAEARSSVVLHLTQNFRSRPAILRFVNRVFSELIRASSESGQPAYEAIAAPPGLPEEPSVLALRFEAPLAESEDLLQAEAMAVTALIQTVARGGYPVRDPVSGTERRSRAGDVMVLARRLTHVRVLEEALERSALRFMVEGGKSFFGRQEVHEVRSVLRAIEDASDRVSLVAALRSAFFGVSDRDIVAYALSGGKLELGPVEPELPGAEALGPAFALLGELRTARTKASVPWLLERLFEKTRLFAALTASRGGEAQIANLEKAVALSHQALDLGVLTLRGFVRLLERRIQDASEEPDLPTTRPGDPDTVRILSIHKAKGLEAPIVVLFDSADNLGVRVDSVPNWAESSIALGFRAGCQPPDWDVLKTGEEAKVRAEGRRLLYVACTRARDYLVIPVPPLDARTGDFWKDLTQRLPAADDADVRFLSASSLELAESVERRSNLKALAAAQGGDAMAARWETERRALLTAACERPLTPVSAMTVAARGAPPPAYVAAGRAGRDFGALVHRALQWLPLDANLEHVIATVASITPVFRLDADAAERAVRSIARTLALPILERARRAPRTWRELPLAFPEGDELIEGRVDLVFEEDGQLVVVDYKTDAIAADQALDQAAHHSVQLRLYGRGLVLATGLHVRERLVVFTSLGKAVPV